MNEYDLDLDIKLKINGVDMSLFITLFQNKIINLEVVSNYNEEDEDLILDIKSGKYNDELVKTINEFIYNEKKEGRSIEYK